MLHAVHAVVWQRWCAARQAYPWSEFLGSVTAEMLPLLVGWLMYTHIFRGSVSGQFLQLNQGTNYITYLAVGLGTHMTLASVMLTVGRSFIMEQREGTLESLLMSPVNRLGYTLGVALYQLMIQILPLAALMISAWLLGARLPDMDLGATLIAGVIGFIGMYGIGLILAAVMLAMRETFITQNMVVQLIYLLSGVFFPVAYLPNVLQWAAKALPPTWTIQLLRGALINGWGPADRPTEFVIAAAVSVGTAVLGAILVGYVEKTALAEMAW